MPLGFLVAMFLACSNRIAALSFHLAWGVCLSVGVEITQAFIGRFPDFTDIISNGTGYACGFVIAQMSINKFGIKPSMLLGIASEENADTIDTLEGIRFIYVTVAFITCLLPLDITVSFSDIYGKLVAVGDSMPRVIVDPLYHFTALAGDLQYLVLNLLLFLPLAFLSAFIQIRRGQPSIFIPAFHCLLLGLCVELANLFIKSGRTDILIPVMGFCGGGLMAYAVVYFSRINGATVPTRHPTKQKQEQPYYLLSMALLYCILLLAISLSPYEFELSIRAIRNKFLVESNFVPFMAHFSTRSIASAVDIVREVILYAPLGAVVALILRANKKKVSTRYALFMAAFTAGSVAVVLELLQLTVTGRYVDLTDCLLGITGGVAGARLAPLFGARFRAEERWG